MSVQKILWIVVIPLVLRVSVSGDGVFGGRACGNSVHELLRLYLVGGTFILNADFVFHYFDLCRIDRIVRLDRDSQDIFVNCI